VTYSVACNRFRIGYIFYNKGGVSNTIRRSRNQFLYVVPPFVAAYVLMSWANERCVLLATAT
jgi:ubiquinol-cytochrome c reductase subunit 8